MKEMIEVMQKEMVEGLENENKKSKSALKMLPSFVSKPSGNESGDVYALDLGGTNFRVLKINIQNGVITDAGKMEFKITKEAMNGNDETLFGFIARCVRDFLKQYDSDSSTGEKKEIHLGFTFSFPVIQDKVDSGKLLEWTKGFKTQGVVGKDVVALLNVAFEREKVNAKVVALANDTVGTMMTNAYKNKNCEMGLILGTGTNACYIEKTANIKKMDFGNKKTKRNDYQY